MNSTFERNNATGWGAAICDEGGDMRVESSKFTKSPGYHVICINGTQSRKAKVSLIDCSVSNNPGPYNDWCTGSGGAIACIDSITLIDHCTINDNKVLIMKENVVGGSNAGLDIVGSDVTLNDTLIQGNEAPNIAAITVVNNSKVTMDHCRVMGNHARKVFSNGEYGLGDGAAISIDSSSEVTINDVIFKDNIADNIAGAIANAGKLNWGRNVVITNNTAKNYSSVFNLASGRINFLSEPNVFGNHDEKPGTSFYSECIISGVEF